VSSTNDGSAVFYNPSALAWLQGSHLDIGVEMAQVELKFNDQQFSPGLLTAPYLAIATPGNLLGSQVGFGIIILAPFQDETPRPSKTPRFNTYEDRQRRFLIGLGAAWAPNDRISFGFGVNYVTMLSSELGVDGVVGFPSPDDSRAYATFDGQVPTAIIPSGSFTLKVSDAITLAGIYRHTLNAKEKQKVVIRADIGIPDLQPVIDDAYLLVDSYAIKSFEPKQAWLSFSGKPNEQWELTADFGWSGWSEYVNPASVTTNEADFGPDFEFNIPGSTYKPPPGYDDTVSVKAGVEFSPWGPSSNLQLRAGAGYETTPIGAEKGLNNLIEGPRSTFAAGATVNAFGWGVFPKPVKIDIFVQYIKSPDILHEKDSPSDLFGDYISSARQLSFGLTSRFEF